MAGQHLVQHHAQTPQIYREPVSFRHQDFWRHVVECAAHGLANPAIANIGTPPKVGNLWATRFAEKDIVWLEVSVHAAPAVQVRDALYNLAIEPTTNLF